MISLDSGQNIVVQKPNNRLPFADSRGYDNDEIVLRYEKDALTKEPQRRIDIRLPVAFRIR